CAYYYGSSYWYFDVW
nr:immunoglobulin heavy chain junction region [Mus musculus]MBK4186749.1 immunoglobulin heavy chain junction region [Mus musculus]MBK4186752.1 immunoglobulin heavy chain junction region [Mus musculus]MBK4189894.1 immunoglobulin heavy chain junction region [Mus musculus]MBK4189895.1 immunoglobulin heavy chain junction region [Mus musculus]